MFAVELSTTAHRMYATTENSFFSAPILMPTPIVDAIKDIA